MSIIKTEAFVLKSFRFGETSKIVTLFTKEFGKMNAIVKGARNFKSRICGTLESMNYISAVIYYKENRDLQMLTNAEYKKSFTNIVTDFEKLEAAYRIIEILNRSLPEHETNKKIFELLINTFNELNFADKDYYYFVLYFQIQFVKCLGLSPDLSDKGFNHETFFENNVFSLNELHYSTLQILAGIELSKIRLLKIDKDTIIRLVSSYEKFLVSQTQGFNYCKSTKVFQELNFNF